MAWEHELQEIVIVEFSFYITLLKFKYYFWRDLLPPSSGLKSQKH
jgi:hypothetical protein